MLHNMVENVSLQRASGDLINFYVWNVLLNRKRPDLVPPQHERRDSHADTLSSLGSRALDVVMLCEVEATKKYGHNGEYIAMRTGHDKGYWFRHSRKGEYIGMFGGRVDHARDLPLPHNKHAVVTKVGNVSIVGVHNKYQKWGPERSEQVEVILEDQANEKYGIYMGDTNDLRWGRSRRMLGDAGYVSADTLLNKRWPITVPTDQYRPLSQLPWPLGISIDAIYVKNLKVKDIGWFEGDSDHRGVGATIEMPDLAA